MPAASALQVLVVDDQQSIRALVRNGLQQLGITNVREAPDGEAALRALIVKPAHLVISDYNMPGMDGLDLLRAIRAYEPLKKTAFIMLTGRADATLVQRASQYGVNNYLIKPFSQASLKQKIEEVFGVLV
jgi:two-component system chemotaxis response regulator CheY